MVFKIHVMEYEQKYIEIYLYEHLICKFKRRRLTSMYARSKLNL